MSRTGCLLLIACVWSLAGCEDDGGGGGTAAGACGGFMACGGDVVGTWSLQDVCFDNAVERFRGELSEPQCAGTFRSVEPHATGTYQLNADGTGTEMVMVSMDVDTLWTTACLKALSGATNIDLVGSCANLEREYTGNTTFEAASCEVQGDACACLITSTPMTVSSGGAYRVEGTGLVDPTDNSVEPFCVEGSTLTVAIAADGLTGMLTLTRQ